MSLLEGEYRTAVATAMESWASRAPRVRRDEDVMDPLGDTVVPPVEICYPSCYRKTGLLFAKPKITVPSCLNLRGRDNPPERPFTMAPLAPIRRRLESGYNPGVVVITAD